MLKHCGIIGLLGLVVGGWSLRAGEDAAKKDAGADQTDWASFRGGAEMTGVAAGTLPKTLRPLWKFDAEEPIYSTAAIVGDCVYVATQGNRVLALSLADGKQLWEFKTSGPVSASPCVSDGRVFIGDEAGTFYALDAKTGKKLWSVETEDKDKIMSSAAVVGGAVIVGFYDYRLMSFDAATGAVNWSFKTELQVHCSPAILAEKQGNGAVVIAGCDKIMRVFDLKTGKERVKVDALEACAASPAMFGGNAYFGNLRGDLLSVDVKTGKVNWTVAYDDPAHPLAEVLTSAAVTEDAAFFATQEKELVRVGRKSGKIEWTYTARHAIDSSPVIVGDRLFIGADGDLLELETATGKVAWKFALGGKVKASPAVGRGRLVIGTSDGILYCFGK